MKETKFNVHDKNPLGELSELRFEMKPKGQEFDLTCQLRLGTMQFEHNGREYSVGISHAHLRLTLEGCETALGSAFGESPLEAVVEEDRLTTEAGVNADLSIGVNSNKGVNAEASVSAGAKGVRTRSLTQSKVHLPVTARPNNSWEVRPIKVTGQPENIIEGTAIPNAALASIRRKQGGNRMAVIGELQVSKSSIKVSAKGGNKVSKSFNQWQNKDAIVSLVLKKALQREAIGSFSKRSSSTVAFSRCEVLED